MKTVKLRGENKRTETLRKQYNNIIIKRSHYSTYSKCVTERIFWEAYNDTRLQKECWVFPKDMGDILGRRANAVQMLHYSRNETAFRRQHMNNQKVKIWETL